MILLSPPSRKPGIPLMPAAIESVHFDPVKSLWMWGMVLPGLLVGAPALDLRLWAISSALAFLTLCLGHSVGLHRGIIHGTYTSGPLLRGILAELFVLSGLGGPLAWARLHAVRDYWQNRRDCPRYFAYGHSLPRDFWWNLHLSFRPADDRALAKLPPHVLRDPWLTFLEATWPLHTAALAGILYVTLGPDAVAACVCGRVGAGILGHWAIGYASHAWGGRPHAIPGAAETGTNNWILGVVAFGEGFHNNHHAFPESPRMGFGRFDLDLGWVALRVFRALGWVRFRKPRAPAPASLR
jgi:stearoyl-CoA desaturase (delta-9 desaturase)